MIRLLLGFTLVLAVGCSPAVPCSVCPKVEGRYAMTYKAVTSESPDCTKIPAPPGPSTIEITRSGAEVRATLNGSAGRGMLQDSNDFSITATEEADGGNVGTLTFRGYFVPPVLKGDGGEPAMINGKWITHTETGGDAGTFCDAQRPATGIKQ